MFWRLYSYIACIAVTAGRVTPTSAALNTDNADKGGNDTAKKVCVAGLRDDFCTTRAQSGAGKLMRFPVSVVYWSVVDGIFNISTKWDADVHVCCNRKMLYLKHNRKNAKRTSEGVKSVCVEGVPENICTMRARGGRGSLRKMPLVVFKMSLEKGVLVPTDKSTAEYHICCQGTPFYVAPKRSVGHEEFVDLRMKKQKQVTNESIIELD